MDKASVWMKMCIVLQSAQQHRLHKNINDLALQSRDGSESH